MPTRKHHVQLALQERQYLHSIIKKGLHQAHEVIHALILLSADEGADQKPSRQYSDQAIADSLHIDLQTVQNVCRLCSENGVHSALHRKKRSLSAERLLLQDEVAQKVIELSCTPPPAGHKRWSLRLLAEQAVHHHLVEKISHQTVSKILADKLPVISRP